MNCKPGDLAVFVRSQRRNHGVVVRVLRLLSRREREIAGLGHFDFVWETDKEVDTLRGPMRVAPDSYVRPLRDPGDDAQDETLSWLPVPSTEKEAA